MARTPIYEISQADLRRAAEISKAYRWEHRLSQTVMAARLGTAPAVISNIENERGNPSSRVVREILDMRGDAPPAAAMPDGQQRKTFI